jgi:hypothetical protein
MLDENLPTFYTKPSSDNPLSSTLFLSQNGSELQPEYTLCRPNPELPASKNCYAVALYDSYNPEVIYAEVLVQPEWTQPTLSQAEIRAQNGVPAPPVPVVPDKFVIQLYNPDQQVTIRQNPGSWNSSAYWEFEMPQNSFRVPSASALDRSQNDPAASDVTPKVVFRWKRNGKLTKDLTCYLSGRSQDGKKGKEPDIPIAMYKGGKDLTLYQPNMHRVEVEDVKGLEVVILLGAAVIKDIFFNANREMFNISSPKTIPGRKNSGSVIPASPVMSGAVFSTPSKVPTSQIPAHKSYKPQQQQSRPPPANARTQWEIDAETARLKALVEKEQQERDRRDLEEQKKIKKMLEAEEKEQRKVEEKERRRRDADVAKETERLRKQYGVTAPMASDAGPRIQYQAPPPMPPRQNYQPSPSQNGYARPQHYQPAPPQRPLSTPSGPPNNSTNASLSSWLQRPSGAGSGPYLQAPGEGTASSSGFFGLGGKKVQKKRSVFF